MTSEILIERGGSASAYWRDLWRYRELFVFLAWRDLLVRYKQTLVGVGWALLRPVLAMAAFTLVFGRIAKLPSEGVPYPVFVMAALLPWQFFSNAVTESGTSLLNSANLLTKVYFPRLLIPASAVLTNIIEFVISLLLFAFLMAGFRCTIGWQIVFAPLFFGLAFALALAAGIWISALTVRFRDLRMVIPFLVQFGFFLSPVGYSSAMVSERWRFLFSLNPLAGIIDGFRWSLLGGKDPLYLPGVTAATVITAIALLSGIRHFRRIERSFADII